MTVEITPLQHVDAVFEPKEWDFSVSHADAIKAHWEMRLRERPQMFNGTVLMQHRWTLTDGIYKAAYSPVAYASFLSWHPLGKPGSARRNGFGMAALRAADGAFLLGVMGAHTANAGKIYFAAGTPDMSDVTEDGRVDLASSMERELQEETGLLPDEFVINDGWVLATDAHRAAFMKPAQVIYDAGEARALMMSRMRRMDDRELADIAIVRGPDDIDTVMTPPFAVGYMRRVFAAEA